MKYGFIEPKVISPQAYVLGGGQVPLNIIKKDGDWSNAKHVKELQHRPAFDTFNCTSFNTLNQIEQYELEAFGELNNYSDRWLGIVAGTKPPGNDPETVYEAIRKYGLIPEEMLPYSDDLKTVEEYYSFKGLTQKQIDACYAEGKKWLEKKNFKHEWVFQPGSLVPKEEKIHNMRVALKYSPLAIAVYAWVVDERGIFIRMGQDNHWTTMPAFTDCLRVKDSYEPVDKDVDQDIYYCKRIHIEKKEPKISIWSKLYEGFFVQKIIFRDFKKFWINYLKNHEN